jgi:hypothetical protein
MSAFLCGPDEVGFGECWFCADTVPEHVTDRRFCSHGCAADWEIEAQERKSLSIPGDTGGNDE